MKKKPITGINPCIIPNNKVAKSNFVIFTFVYFNPYTADTQSASMDKDNPNNKLVTICEAFILTISLY